ncbi:UDP-N-acetylglucosamine 2-epimerase [Sphingobacterium daejeonense]|uniref:UDP-N-acetylglucosamine 2-epimerase n=1 Tax=Sphingobacterium daejeonense TaxID=371142 RepID=UPI0018D78B84|nr:UDP-N-acetylglucosamine 2-epimerase [Sphingobacterium daejeonense]
MSHLHFVSTEEYRQRVIQMGEPEENVFHVGAIGLDNIRDFQLLTKSELEEELGINSKNTITKLLFILKL